MTKVRDLSTFVSGPVVVKTVLNTGGGSRSRYRVVPIPEEGFPPNVRVQCSNKMRESHPVGTMFRLHLSVRDTGKSPTLYAHHDDPYEIVEPEEIALAAKLKKYSHATRDEAKLVKRVGWLLANPVFLKKPPKGIEFPQKRKGTAAIRQRSPLVAAWVRNQADGKCEACGKKAPFKDAYGFPFLEVHHVLPLSCSGPDTVDNAVAICPNCHRAFHYARNSNSRTEKLYSTVSRLRRYD